MVIRGALPRWHQPVPCNGLRCLRLPFSFIAQTPDQSSKHDTDSSSVFSLFSAVGLSLTMSHSWAPRTGEMAAGPAGRWLCSSPDILGNVELFESKGNKSFANVNTNDCGKGLVLKERLRILDAYWVIFLAGNSTRLLWEWWRQNNSHIFNDCSYWVIFNYPRLKSFYLIHFDSSCFMFCLFFSKFANLSLQISSWILLYHIFFEYKGTIILEVYVFDYILSVSWV